MVTQPRHAARAAHTSTNTNPTTPKLLTLAIAQALMFQAANAATIEVTSNLDDGTGCTLREAVESINQGSNQGGCTSTGVFGDDIINFAPAVQGSTITLTGGELSLNYYTNFSFSSVSINPTGSETTITANGASQVLYFNGAVFTSNADLTLNQLVITGGNTSGRGGGIQFSGGDLTLTNSTITGNTSSNSSGGGIYAYSPYGDLTLTDTTVSANSAGSVGGGIRVRNFQFNSNNVTLTNSTVSGNSANISGGGIDAYLYGGMTATLTNSTVSGNSAGSSSGGMSMRAGYFYRTTITLTDSTVSDNTAANGRGGGISAYGGSGASVTLTDSTVSGNSANVSRGGMSISSGYFYRSTVTLTNSTVSDNTAANGSGGGISAYGGYGASVTLTDSTVSGNTSNSRGGGIRAVGYGFIDSRVDVTLINSTVSGNSATDYGGGISASGYIDATATLTNSTVSDNSGVTARGGGIDVYSYTSASATLVNSIIANSLSGDDCYVGGNNTVAATAGADSIIADGSCGTSAQAIDPGLMPLADNGGPTETHALMPGSPAIDGGSNTDCGTGKTIDTDQRGEARDDGACDIGAYEFKATVMPIAKKDRKMGSLMSNGEQWYSFSSSESQKLSMQTNGFSGDTVLDFYKGDTFANVMSLSMDDDSGPDLFSNIKQTVTSGPYLIRVKGKTDVNPYWLRLMSDKDILSFGDTSSHFANKEIRVMSSAGITGGCGTNKYCPSDPVTRAQMAIFMLKAILGGNHSSPPAIGSLFGDVSTSSFGANFIEEFSTLGITSGCGGGNYCPDLAVTREQMAVFLLRAWYGGSYTPPTATPAEVAQFSDIGNSFAKDWIVQLTKEGITGGCGGGKFCPTDTVTRGQMAAFIARTFSLDVDL